jgi:hypothetical protein
MWCFTLRFQTVDVTVGRLSHHVFRILEVPGSVPSLQEGLLTEAFFSLSKFLHGNGYVGLYFKVCNFHLIRKLNLCRNGRQVCVTFELENTSLNDLRCTEYCITWLCCLTFGVISLSLKHL